MAKQDDSHPLPLPVKLPKPAQRALTQAGIVGFEQLTAMTETDLLRLHGVGPLAIDRLRRALAEQGMTFKPA